MTGFPTVTGASDAAAIKYAIQQAMQGKLNCTGDVNLTANVTTTVKNDPLCGSNSVIMLMPTTANAAGAISTTYVSARSNGSFTLTHANNAQTDRD
ncbi:MAG: hypothetical protein ACPH3M_08300, partial [Candidatus Puniceispirillales bacterium]